MLPPLLCLLLAAAASASASPQEMGEAMKSVKEAGRRGAAEMKAAAAEDAAKQAALKAEDAEIARHQKNVEYFVLQEKMAVVQHVMAMTSGDSSTAMIKFAEIRGAKVSLAASEKELARAKARRAALALNPDRAPCGAVMAGARPLSEGAKAAVNHARILREIFAGRVELRGVEAECADGHGLSGQLPCPARLGSMRSVEKVLVASRDQADLKARGLGAYGGEGAATDCRLAEGADYARP